MTTEKPYVDLIDCHIYKMQRLFYIGGEIGNDQHNEFPIGTEVGFQIESIVSIENENNLIIIETERTKWRIINCLVDEKETMIFIENRFNAMSK